MATIHIHPTAAQPATVARIQRRTGLLAIVRGGKAVLVSGKPAARPSQTEQAGNWPGPGAA